MSIHDALITPWVVFAPSPHLQARCASLRLGGLFLQFKHLHLFEHSCPLRTHGQRVALSLLSFTTQNCCDLDLVCRPQWQTFSLLGNSASLSSASPMQEQHSPDKYLQLKLLKKLKYRNSLNKRLFIIYRRRGVMI